MCSAACSAPSRASSGSAVEIDLRRQLVPQRLRGERGLRQVEPDEVEHLVVAEPPGLVGDDLLRHHDGPERQPDAEPLAPVVEPLDVHVGLALGLRVPVAVERAHERAPQLEVELRHLVGAAAVQVDRALVRRVEGAAGVDVAEQLAGGHLDDREAVVPRRAQRHRARRVLAGVTRDERPARPPAQLAHRLEPRGGRLELRPEPLRVGRGQRSLVRGAEHVPGVDLLVRGIEDRRLDGPVEELVRMAAEELVERVLAGDVDREPAAAPARAPPHLAQRGDRAGERHADRRVERTDVDPQLERVGRDDPEQVAGHEPPLQLAPLLRRVAGAVRRDPLGELRAPAVLERELGEARHQLDGLARLHEDDRPRAAADQLGEQVGGLGERGAPQRERLVGDRRVPHRDRLLRAGRAVAVDHGDVVEARQALGELARVRHRRATPAGSAARSRRRRRSAAAGAARSRRASRTRRDTRAPRRPRRPRGWRTRPPTPGGWAARPGGACPGS